MPTAYVLIFDGFADWEPASALAELRRHFGFAIRSVGVTRKSILSMGGLRLTPDVCLHDFEVKSADLLILPGGDCWMKEEVRELSPVLRALAADSRPIAGICAATLALAHAGLLDDRKHTSNGRGFIEKYVPRYRGQNHYRAERAVSDRGVITANGLSPFHFAAEIFRVVAPERLDDIAMYTSLYERGLLEPGD